MREDTVFSPQSPLNALMLRFLFVPISNIVYVSDPFSSYVNLLDIWYWKPERATTRFRNDSLELGISVIDLDPRYCFIRLWSVDVVIAVVFCIECLLHRNRSAKLADWSIGLNFGFVSWFVDIGINLGRLLFFESGVGCSGIWCGYNKIFEMLDCLINNCLLLIL